MTDNVNTFDKRVPGEHLRLTGEIFAAPKSGWFGVDAVSGPANGASGDSDAPRRQQALNSFFGASRSSTRGERAKGD